MQPAIPPGPFELSAKTKSINNYLLFTSSTKVLFHSLSLATFLALHALLFSSPSTQAFIYSAKKYRKIWKILQPPGFSFLSIR